MQAISAVLACRGRQTAPYGLCSTAGREQESGWATINLKASTAHETNIIERLSALHQPAGPSILPSLCCNSERFAASKVSAAGCCIQWLTHVGVTWPTPPFSANLPVAVKSTWRCTSAPEGQEVLNLSPGLTTPRCAGFKCQPHFSTALVLLHWQQQRTARPKACCSPEHAGTASESQGRDGSGPSGCIRHTRS